MKDNDRKNKTQKNTKANRDKTPFQWLDLERDLATAETKCMSSHMVVASYGRSMLGYDSNSSLTCISVRIASGALVE